MPHLGSVIVTLVAISAFAFASLLAATVLAVASIWLPIAAWQMYGSMLFFGLIGATFARWWLR